MGTKTWTGLVIAGAGAGALAALFGVSLARADVPVCYDASRPIPIDNAKALQLKKTAPLGQSFRAYVEGRVVRDLAVRNSHEHFEIQIGDGKDDLVEVVYNEAFGNMPDPHDGAHVIACGDFINSFAPFKEFPPSPAGAIIHWVHRSPNARHESGFVIVDNVTYGSR